MDSEARLDVTAIPSPPPPPNIEATTSYDALRGTGTPIIIDNGSTSMRYGYASWASPRSQPNVVARYKDRRTNRPVLLFGDAVDCETGAKSQAKYPWEGDVLLNFDALECALDHVFLRLGIDTSTVEHPILMSERFSSPLHSRALTSELLFESYRVPSAAYCVDSIMSYFNNDMNARLPGGTIGDGLIIGFHTASTCIIPVLDGAGVQRNAKRIPWGVTQSSEYLLKLIQLKYPNFPSRITQNHATWMYRTFCSFSDDYAAQLRLLTDPLNMKSASKIVQFPFAAVVESEKTEEELARIAERRREQGKKLQEMAARVRLEKLVQKETDLQYLSALREERSSLGKREWMQKLQSEGMESDAVLEETIKKLENALKRARKKEVDGEEPVEEQTYPLVDVPDEQLDEEQIKEKRRQRLMKAGADARIRARKEKEREREERVAEETREQEDRDRDLQAWSSKMRDQHETLVLKIRDRSRRKAALSDRKSAASQARMKSIANLAADEKTGRKKRKAGGDDMFGANDDDWAIYRKINVAAPSSDEEDDLAQLEVMEQKLLQHDPTFNLEDTHTAMTTRRSALTSAFRPEYQDGDVEGHNRVHLNIERWRVPETIFNPSMAGMDSAGLGEVAQGILAAFTNDEAARLAKNVFVTGAPSQLPGLLTRAHSTLRPLLAPETNLNVTIASDPTLDAWRGMARFASTNRFNDIVVTKEEYEEWGGERIRRWWGGNFNGAV